MGSDDDDSGKPLEYFGEEPPKEEEYFTPRRSLFWTAVRAIAIIATAIYLIAVLAVPIATHLYSLLPGTSPNATNACGFISSYGCSNPALLSNGNITFSFLQNTGATLYNVTLYAVPFSSNFTPAQASLFPKSKKIASMFSGEILNMTMSGGASGYVPTGKGRFSANIVITFASALAGVQAAQVMGYMTVTPK